MQNLIVTMPVVVFVHQAAVLLNRSKAATQKLIEREKLKSVEVGGRRCVPISEIERLTGMKITPEFFVTQKK